MTWIYGSIGECADTYMASIPAGVSNKRELLSVFAQQLRFPNYFGYNWDALDECLRDLEWVPQRVIVISHEDLPLRNDPAELEKYFTVLRSCTEHWQRAEDHDVKVVFPALLKEEIEEIRLRFGEVL